MNNIDATRLCKVSNILYNKTILELSKQINELKKENKKLKKENEKLKKINDYYFDDISGNLIPYGNVSYPESTRSFRNNKI
tara:strand:+ start:119 stop:361 length:243 start_codon:yes stop_codon:yes gene_type:complete